MAAVTAEHGWDGEWFLRAYDYFGNPVGSARSAEGQIFIEPQGICVMARDRAIDARRAGSLGRHACRAGAGERAASARDRPHGVMLLQPAFTTYHVELGEISSYPPGYKENASVFCHTNPWVMIAAAMTGDGDAASTTTSGSTPRPARRSATSTAASRTSTRR